MSSAFSLAGILLVLLAVAHSVIGERLIFRAIRDDAQRRRSALEALPQRRWNAIWSTWHLVSLLGAGLGVALVAGSQAASAEESNARFLWTITATMGVAAIYWFAGTRGKHPAWAVLFLIFGALAYGLTRA